MSAAHMFPIGGGFQGAGDIPMEMLVSLMLVCCIASSMVAYFMATRGRKVVMVDFACFSPPQRMIASALGLIEGTLNCGGIGPDDAEFHKRVLNTAGIDDVAAFPDALVKMPQQKGFVKPSYQDSLDESREVMFTCTQDLLNKTGIDASEIGIVMVCCSCFSAMPSFAAHVVNHFKMNTDVLTYSFSGMGCATSLCCVDLARNMLQSMPNTLCLIVGSENLTSQAYPGSDKSMQIVNCLFRVGGHATLLSNRKKDFGQAKYDLTLTTRTHLGSNDEAFNCMGTKQDEVGHTGTFLRKTVAGVAAQGMAVHMKKLGRAVLPYTEQLRYARNMKTYIPDFGTAFEHFLIHTGGKAILDGMQKKLNLTDAQVGPSRDSYWRFGNTSVASTWYILARIESEGLMKKGDRIWQIGAGGAFKCCSATWKARKTMKSPHKCWK